jgi:benzoate/toluate 1,2-dioxygenase beta subunit
LLLQCDAEAAQVSAVFTCHRFEPRMNRQLCFFGRYEYDLRAVADGWKIARKKIILLNDTIPTMVDIDSI